MKTHDVAKALMHLSRILRAGPNVDMESVGNLGLHADSGRGSRASPRDAEDKGAALALLAGIAQYSKGELSELIKFLDIPVEVKNTDSVRDLLGRTLKFISDNPSVQNRLAAKTSDKQTGDPPALARALSILLNQQ